MRMMCFVMGLEADGWHIIHVYEQSVVAWRPGGRYRLFMD
jgi:hypothetical protein